MIGIDVLGIETLYAYGNEPSRPFVIKIKDGMCGRESYKVYVAINNGKAEVEGCLYKVVLNWRGTKSTDLVDPDLTDIIPAETSAGQQSWSMI